MSDHYLDLITDLINGRLSPGERDAALALIASDPELQSEYDVQLAAAAFLHDLPAPAMTANERTALHASLREQLHLEEAVSPVVAPAPSRWQRWWAPATALTAAAAVVVGAVVILPGSGTDDSFEPVAAVISEPTETSRNSGASTDGGMEFDGSADNEQTAPTTPADAATTTTAAASEEMTTTAASSADGVAGEVPRAALPHMPDVDLEQIALAYAADPAAFGGFDSLMTDSPSADALWMDTCLAEASSAAADASVVIPVATTTVEDTEAIVLSVAPPDAESYLVALDLSTCVELDTTRP